MSTQAEIAVVSVRRNPGLAYLKLTKPRVISLLLVTTFATMFIASDGAPSLMLVVFTLLGGSLAAGGANAINQYIDRDIDGKMGRTGQRPIPSGDITPARALAFGLGLAVASFVILAFLVNLLSAALALSALLFYVFVYTKWLKRTTPSNIVIGGAAGAMPPMIGWTAVTGDISLMAIWLFVIVFYWTPPHFWALSLLIKTEYGRARIPMLPNVHGDEATRRQILLYSILLVAITIAPYPLGLRGIVYLISALVLGAFFVVYAARLRHEGTTGAARRLFRYSMYYLALLFVSMVLDHRLFL
jgi:heme o synthase